MKTKVQFKQNNQADCLIYIYCGQHILRKNFYGTNGSGRLSLDIKAWLPGERQQRWFIKSKVWTQPASVEILLNKRHVLLLFEFFSTRLCSL
jgi:hypothetical protein